MMTMKTFASIVLASPAPEELVGHLHVTRDKNGICSSLKFEVSDRDQLYPGPVSGLLALIDELVFEEKRAEFVRLAKDLGLDETEAAFLLAGRKKEEASHE